MRLPLLVLVVISCLSLLLPLPRHYVGDGSIIRETLAALRVPAFVLRAVLHPACISPVAYYVLLRAIHFLLSIPVRLFLSGFGLNVRSFSGTSFSGLLLTVRVRGTTEVIVRVDEVGIDIRTMRRLRMRLRGYCVNLRNQLRSRRGAAYAEASSDATVPEDIPATTRDSIDSQRPVPEATSAGGDCSPAGSGDGQSSALSKRLQLYARGVHIQLFAVSPIKPQSKGEDSLWFDVGTDSNDSTPTPQEESADATAASADATSSEAGVLDSEAQELAVKLAKRLSTLLRTYAYFASLFARWVDFAVSDVSLMIVHSSDMARAGHGVTLHLSRVLLWAESARESYEGDGDGTGWIPSDIQNSLRGIIDWLLRLLKIRRGEGAPANDMSQHHSPPLAQKRDRSHKYLSTLALEINGIRLFPGIEGAQQHINSRWELVKMLVVQDMLASRNPHDSDKPHRRGPVVHCQRCTIRNDVITTFWGLPKKVDQSIELGQTHVRAGIIEPLLDEVAIMCIAPEARSSDFSIRGLRSLNSHLASVLRQYNSNGGGPSADDLPNLARVDLSHDKATPGSDGASQPDIHVDAPTSHSATAVEARDHVHRMLFQLHEILSRLRLEHVGIALRVADLVFDLPLASVPGSLIVKAPGMLRWRQRNIEVEAGYMWGAISSGPESSVNVAKAEGSGDSERKVSSNMWSDGAGDLFSHEFESTTTRRSKDSTAFVRLATGTTQVTALRTPSMTPDLRAEELLSDMPGLKLRYCTLYGEMSAFLSEDLAQQPSPQPVFSLDVGRPELTLDLSTQLAFDEAKVWLGHIKRRFSGMLRMLKDSKLSLGGAVGSNKHDHFVNYHVLALVSLVFSDVKAHITVERAMYAVQPLVPLFPQDANTVKDERIELRMQHLECHLLWSLSESSSRSLRSVAPNTFSGDSDSDSCSFVTGHDSFDSSLADEYSARFQQKAELVLEQLSPSVQFRLTSSPITAQWTSTSAQQAGAARSVDDVAGRTLLQMKHGIRARGNVDLLIGPTTSHSTRPRVNINVDVEVGEVSGRLREYDFRKWLSMQPLWLVTELLHLAGLNYSNHSELASHPLKAAAAGSSAAVSDELYVLPPLDARRTQLAATTHMLFESIRVSILACDNEEDVRSGIEHGTQLCFQHGFVDVRVNGGSVQSPHPFGFRTDVAKTTLNVECQKATMFLLSAVPTQSARAEVLHSGSQLPAGFSLGDLDGYLPDSVQPHIVLISPQFNFSRQKLEPFRSRLIFELNTTSLDGVTSVSSIYRWSVFMRHIQYWLRRKRLARRMATQAVEPSPPDDLIVSINSELLDLQGSLVSPVFFNLDKGLVKCFQTAKDESECPSNQSPEARLKIPHVEFAVERTKLGTGNDMKLSLKGPIATIYGSVAPKGQAARCRPQPLMSLKGLQATLCFPRKAKREQLGAEHGVRGNNSYDNIDVVFERGAMAFGHQYNMADTIDGFVLLQKGCKRIARKSTSTCHPPLPFLETALEQRPTNKMVLAALGNHRTFMPPPLRSLSGVKPPPPPTLSVPEDIPTINFHGPEFSMMVHDDPFETALSRIYQVGLHEQRERLSRLESFDAKAQEIRAKREQEFAQQSMASKRSGRSARGREGSPAKGAPTQSRRGAKVPKGGRAMRGASTFSSGDRVSAPGVPPTQQKPPGLGSARTFTSGQSQPHQTRGAYGNILDSGMRSVASASVQDVTTSEMASKEHSRRARTNSTAADGTQSRTFTVHARDTGPGAAVEADLVDYSSDMDDNDSSYEDVGVQPLKSGGAYQRMVDAVNADIDAARMRLMAVESREWVSSIRQKMMPPHADGEHEHSSDDMHFEEIFAMPTPAWSAYRDSANVVPRSGPPYSYVPGSWTHPSAPLGRLVMSPVWISLDTPQSLLEFGQIESYLRLLDPATPHSLKWATLIPMRMRIKCGDIRMQLRDFPFPMFRVPDPYRPETSQAPPHGGSTYESFFGGVELSGSVIIAERIAHERSLRSVYIPIGPRSRQSGIDIPNVGWYIAKSLQFPRIFSALSIMMYSVPSDDPYADVGSFQQKYLQSRLPPLPIMSTWGASYQPVISALMQRLESATTKSADVSPNLPWWDKMRSRMHVKCRMAVIDAPPLDKPNLPDADPSESYLELSSAATAAAAAIAPAGRRQPAGNCVFSSDSDCERGQMFFLALDGRDPYQVTQKTGGYLFTMRGGVRICLNEGVPGTDLWDKLSGRGIYSVPTEESAPPSATLGEFMRLRCEEFLMGVPIIVDRKSAIIKSMDSARAQSGAPANYATPGVEDIEVELGMPQQSLDAMAEGRPLGPRAAPADIGAAHGSQSWKRSYADLLHSIVSDNSARYTFITHGVDRLYHKALLHLSGGVRVGIGLSSYIPPDPAGYRHNHWEVQPIAPESAVVAAIGGLTDAYVGYRSSKLHTSVSLLCPFTETEPLAQKTFSDLYLTLGTSSSDLAMPRLRQPEALATSKPFIHWSVYDTDALVSPMYSLFPGTKRTQPMTSEGAKVALTAQDLFFVPFPYPAESKSPESTPTAFSTTSLPPHADERASARPQCRISASAAAVGGIQSYLPLYVSRMMLPVRKGTMYPFSESSDTKLGKCLRSMRLVLDLKNVELTYSQRDFEIKELESRELSLFGFEDASCDPGQSPTASDASPGQCSSGAKAEGSMRELKARVESFSFNLLFEQTSVKISVGSHGLDNSAIAGKNASSPTLSHSAGAHSSAKRDRARSDSTELPHTRKSRGGPDSPARARATAKAEAKAEARAEAKAEAKALRWGVGDASTEIDYLDVRLTQMSFVMPLFMNSLASEVLSKSRRLNGLRFAEGSLSGLTDAEKSWISCSSIRDLKELDISEAIFSNPRVVCVLWSPRMVYFTQRPEWNQLGEQLEGMLDPNAGVSACEGSPNIAASVLPSAQSIPTMHLGAAESLSAMLMPTKLDGPVAAFSTLGEPSRSSLLQRSLSAQRNRAISDVKQAGQFANAYTLEKRNGSDGEDAAVSALHRRNTSMPWVLGRQLSYDGGGSGSALHSARAYPAPGLAAPPTLPPPPLHSFYGNIPPAVSLAQRASTQPTMNTWNAALADPAVSAGSAPLGTLQPTDPLTASDTASDTKSPSSAMPYKSSFHLLELARSRQRRLTASNSRQTMTMTLPAGQTVQDAISEHGTVDLHRQSSIPIEQALVSFQQTRMMPTGPDPNVIMRDSRSTQASLLRKRKEMLGTAIQHEQAALVHLSREFERASSRHSEGFRREMVRRAEHIYELGARRKLINRCLRFLGVDLDAADAENVADKAGEPVCEDGAADDLDRDTQEVEKVLATLYRHRCLIYSGYLIWTSQVRDELMRFLYIQDCLTAIEYYMSETATKVVSNATSTKGEAGSADTASTGVHGGDGKGKNQAASSTAALQGESVAKNESSGSGNDENEDDGHSTPSRVSIDQRSNVSAASRRTLNLPKMLRRLRSSDKVEGSRDSTGRGFLWRSKKGQRGERNSVQNQRQPKPPQKPKERRKEEYKPPQHRVGSNKFDQGLSRIWDDFMRYRPYYSFLVEFLNSQVSMRVDEKTSTTSAIAVAERVQLHRILLCNESSCVAEDAAFGEPSRGHLNPPDDESIVKTRNLIELENVQVFTAKRDDFENQAAYFVDCTYGSQLEGDASQPSAIWPAWIPIELLLSQSKHRARGIFDDLDGERRAAAAKAEAEVDVKAGLESDIESDDGSDSDGRSFASHSLMSDGQSQIPRFYQGKRGSGKYSKAWWLEDLSKYKCLMDRNNGLVVYDKANPHRIQGDTSDRIGYAAAGDASADAAHVAASAASEGMSGAGVPPSATSSGVGPGAEKGRPAVAGLFGGSIRKQSMSESVGEDDSDTDSIDDTEAVGSNQGLSHRANHFAVFLPELNLACTTEQYTAIYETVTELIVFIDPEKAAYMDHLNTILLGMDMGDLRGLLAVIRATQQALRERLPIIQDWYVIQRSNAVLFRDASRAMVSRDHWPLLALDIMHQKSRAASLLTLDRHRQALELQLRTAMDLFGAAQKQLEQQRRRVDDEQKARAAQMAAASTQNQDPAAAARSTPSSRRPTFSSVAGASIYGRGMGAKASHAAAADEPLQSAATDHRRMSLVSASSRSTGSQVAEETQNTIARTIHIYISKATWHMLENDGQPLCDMTLRWATLKAVTTSDQATHLLSEVHLLYIVNQQPNPMFTDLVGPYVRPKHSKPDFCVEKMIRVRWSELAPVGGISIVERFEVDLFPLRLQFSHDIAQKLVNYLYPPQEGGINGSGGGDGTSASNQYSVRSATASRSRRPAFPSTASNTLSPSMSATTTAISGGGVTVSNDSQIVQLQPPPKGNSGSGVSLFASKLRRNVGEQPPKGLEGTVSTRGLPAASTPGAAQQLARMSQSPQLSSGLFAAMSGRSSTPLSLFTESNSMINISQSGENRDQVDQMKKRASSNKTFLNVKIGGSTLCISYQGKKANNITDLRDFEFHAPTLELRNQVESYYELLMQVKKEYMSVVVHHTGALVKEKFRQLHSRKAWNKASFGPDWEARKLLIDMDRRVDEDMVANMHGSSGGSTADFEGFPSSAPRQKAREAVDIGGGTSGASNALVMDAASSYSVLAVDSQGTQQPVTVLSSGSAPPCGGEGADAAAVDSDDAASVHSAMGKAPLSKYMILDPRKLMGKRLPSVLPRNFTRLDHLAGRAESPASMPPSLRPASPGKSLGSRTLYSAMHLDMLPAASGAISSEPTPSSPVHSVGRRDKRAATAGSPLPSVVLTAPDGQDAFAGGGESGD